VAGRPKGGILHVSRTGFLPDAIVPDRRARAASRVTGWALVALGAAGLIGWVLVVPSLLMPAAAFPALSFTEALGVFALGTGLVGLGSGRGHRGAIVVGGAAALFLGGVTLAGLAGPLLGALDREATLFGVGGYAPVRLPVSSAILLLFAGAALASFALRVRRDFGRLTAGLFGAVAVVFSIGVMVMRAVWLTELEGMLLVGSSIQMLASALPAGVCLVFAAWSADPPATLSTLRVPLSVGVACLVTALFLWRTVDSYERRQIRRQTAMAARAALREIYRQAETGTRALSRIARFSPTPEPASAQWANGIVALTRDIDGLRAVAWTDRSARVREFRPTPVPSDTAQLALQRRLAGAVAGRGAASEHEVSYFALGDSGRSFAAAVPICDRETCHGYVVGVFDALRLMEPILLRRDQGYTFQVSTGGRRLLGPRRLSATTRRWVERGAFTLGDVTWDLAVWPGFEQLRQARTRLPDLLLLLGLLGSALLPVTVRLGQINWMRARLAERVRLNLALETATDSIWEWNVLTDEATRGEALWRHLGYLPSEVAGTMTGWMDLVHPDDRRRVSAALTDHLTGRTPTFEEQYRIRDRSGGWHWLIDRGRVVERASSGAAIRLLGISADITERKRTDEARERAEQALRETESLSTMGRLAARIAHEINNPLAGIQNAFRLVKDAIPSNHPHRRYVGAIEGEITRIAAVTRQLYETYRPEHSAARETAVAGLIGDAVAMLEQVNREADVHIVTDLSRAPSLVPLPDAVLRQAVYNLVQNAVEASPPGGTVTVSATVEQDHLVLRVRDQGPGVPKEIRDRIFDPFFTTKSATVRTGGMGLGLSLVHRSVQAFGGRVALVDLPGGGTEFEVRLPLSPIATGVEA
jgi:hypothetical protein